MFRGNGARLWAVTFAGLLTQGTFAAAAEIRGTVSGYGNGIAQVTTDSEWLPQVGDKAEIMMELKSLKTTALVTTGKVSQLSGITIAIQVDNAKASVQSGQLVKITSEHPTPKATAALPAPPTKPETHPPVEPPPLVGGGTETVSSDAAKITFDQLKAAPGLSREAFATQGFFLMLGDRCDARIEKATSAMVMPPGRKQLLMVVQDPAASRFGLSFANPVRKVTVTRPGVTNGASMPKWKLTAMTEAGQVLATTGEDEFGSDPKPKTFSVTANGIVQVSIDADNHWRNGTYATFSCLPITEIDIEPNPLAENSNSPVPPAAIEPAKDNRLPPFNDVPGAN
jgi:hypothetical protein